MGQIYEAQVASLRKSAAANAFYQRTMCQTKQLAVRGALGNTYAPIEKIWPAMEVEQESE